MPLDITRLRLDRHTYPLVLAWKRASCALCVLLWLGGWWAFLGALLLWCVDVAAMLDLARTSRTLVNWRLPFVLSPVHSFLKYVVAGSSPWLPAVRPFSRLLIALYFSIATIEQVEQYVALRSRR